MRKIGYFPKGRKRISIISGWNNKMTIRPQHCYDGFNRYKINDKYYWYYDEEQVYHIEDRETGKIVYVAIARCPQDVINSFLEEIE